MLQPLSELKIIIRGAGEMATGTAVRLHRSGFSRLFMTEIPYPLSVRRLVSFSSAVYEKTWTVEGVRAVKVESLHETHSLWEQGVVPVFVDPANSARTFLEPDVIVDAILAKRNLDTTMQDAPLVVGLGPGFCAGQDVHYVVETQRGHDLGRLFSEGEAAADTGVPGEILGEGKRRVIRSPAEGLFRSTVDIGSIVNQGQLIGRVDAALVHVHLNGILRGLIRSGTHVTRGLKIGDVDPRANPAYLRTISEKARAIGGSVLEAILMRFNKGKMILS
jgi:xanthine dehydrogenase accessory factor